MGTKLSGRQCTVCASKQRRAVDRMLLAGAKATHVHAKYPHLSVPALKRHRRHLQRALNAGARDVGELKYGGSLIDQLSGIQHDISRIQAVCESSGDPRGALAALAEKLKALELAAKLQGQIITGSRSLSVTNINVHPDELMSDEEALAAARAWLWERGFAIVPREQKPQLEGEVARCT